MTTKTQNFIFLFIYVYDMGSHNRYIFEYRNQVRMCVYIFTTKDILFLCVYEVYTKGKPIDDFKHQPQTEITCPSYIYKEVQSRIYSMFLGKVRNRGERAQLYCRCVERKALLRDREPMHTIVFSTSIYKFFFSSFFYIFSSFIIQLTEN